MCSDKICSIFKSFGDYSYISEILQEAMCVYAMVVNNNYKTRINM